MKLTDKEQRHVRTVLRFLRFKVGGWQPLANALGVQADSISKVLRGSRDVTAKLAYSVAGSKAAAPAIDYVRATKPRVKKPASARRKTDRRSTRKTKAASRHPRKSR